MAVPPGEYSALSVTPMRDPAGRLVVMLRVPSDAGSAVARSLERYGYETIHTLFPEDDLSRRRAMDRANELLRYLTV